jgi:WD40 repeat protein
MKPNKQWKLLALSFLPLALIAAVLCRPHGTSPPNGLTPIAILKGHRLPVQALAFSSEGTALASAAYYHNAPESGAEVVAWDVKAGTSLAKRTEQMKRLHCLAFAPGGRRLAAAQVMNPEQEETSETGHSLWLWETAYAHEKGRSCGLLSPINALAFSNDGAQLAAVDFANDVSIRDVASGQPRTHCKRQDEPVYSLTFAPDGAVLATGSWAGTIRLWDTATGEERGTLRGHTMPVLTLAFSPDGRSLVSGDMAGTVKLWDVAEGTMRAMLGTYEDEVSAVAFSPDGGTLAVAVGRTVRLWDLKTRSVTANLEGHEGRVKCLAYSSDGTLLASGGYDKTVRLWRVAQAAGPLHSVAVADRANR